MRNLTETLQATYSRMLGRQLRTDRQTWSAHKAFFNLVKRVHLMQYVIEGNTEGRIEVTGRRGRRRKQLLDDFKEKGGYCRLKDEALQSVPMPLFVHLFFRSFFLLCLALFISGLRRCFAQWECVYCIHLNI